MQPYDSVRVLSTLPGRLNALRPCVRFALRRPDTCALNTNECPPPPPPHTQPGKRVLKLVWDMLRPESLPPGWSAQFSPDGGGEWCAPATRSAPP